MYCLSQALTGLVCAALVTEEHLCHFSDLHCFGSPPSQQKYCCLMVSHLIVEVPDARYDWKMPLGGL